ncbi:TetR-like C-terminal domain-containing protein [Streptomyces lydicus]|uniref:TetR-like C-terminal domain-containing protein n=2 Tax=Streptomyces lydicus TaxID=47763 RepID=UPI0037AD2A84
MYGVMFGGAGFGGLSLTEEDLQHGRYTLEPVVRAVEAAMAANRFRRGDAWLVAHQRWIALHGLVTLELGGLLGPPYEG